MKEIKAIIKPFMLEKLLSALDAMDDLPGVTISEIMGWGRLPERRQEHDVVYEGHGLSKKVKVEIVVQDEWVQRVVEEIAAATRTGNPGDGKIFVCEVMQVVRIRTGESGAEAI
ncbi:MAG: P-II family nitrogen regulator [Myxococcales bacterium]|nr:P-II family nitrogen regulator [Myxococcales bacterium]